MRLTLLVQMLAAATSMRLVEWNVYWGALDDAFGRVAITAALDGVATADFAAIVEAEGDTPEGKLQSWSAPSKLLSALKPLTTHSGHETLALYYNTSAWKSTYSVGGAFTPGRPWLLARFEAAAGGSEPIWIMAVHFPHFLDTPISPGASIAAALDAASKATGGGLTPSSNLVFMGDFNEFEWEDNPCPRPFYPPDCRAQAAARMAPLWQGWLKGSARDVATNHTTTCCTKWAPKDRHTTSYREWRFEYDHVFVSGEAFARGSSRLIPYAYPGTSGACADEACTGEDPPRNVTALHQGSWHRGWVVDV